MGRYDAYREGDRQSSSAPYSSIPATRTARQGFRGPSPLGRLKAAQQVAGVRPARSKTPMNSGNATGAINRMEFVCLRPPFAATTIAATGPTPDNGTSVGVGVSS